jgi:MoaA/NifB/PqqE/SkfB family radical SAM enzyme
MRVLSSVKTALRPLGRRIGSWQDALLPSNMFENINVETTTRCNRRCANCPNSVFDRSLPQNEKRMPEALFRKIVDELGQAGYSGKFSPHFYGEPLLDERLTDLLVYARKAMPKARIVLKTNGDSLTVKLFGELLSIGVDLIHVSQYSDKPGPVLSALCDYTASHPEKAKRFRLEAMTPDRPLFNRGGLVRPPVVDSRPRCLSPLSPVVVTWSGDVVLCCNDYLGQVVFGNVGRERLLDIWKSRRFKDVRRSLRHRRFTLPICRKCVGLE